MVRPVGRPAPAPARVSPHGSGPARIRPYKSVKKKGKDDGA